MVKKSNPEVSALKIIENEFLTNFNYLTIVRKTGKFCTLETQNFWCDTCFGQFSKFFDQFWPN